MQSIALRKWKKIEQIKLYQEEKAKTHINLTYSIDPLLTETTLDSDRFSQIILNLLTNAVKFTEIGTIFLKIRKIDNSYIELIVSDTGVGIEKSKQKIIFERFRQAKESDNFKGGTGLGLAITKALVEKMGGEISVDSAPNQGSTFIIKLPIGQKELDNVQISTTNDMNENKSSKTKVLVAEDEEINFFYIKEVLDCTGINVIHAENGKIAIELFKKEQPDLVIMDIKMPIMDGYKALKEIKELKSSIPVIALTAHALFGDREKALDAGFDAYLSKPVSEEDILKAVNQFIGE